MESTIQITVPENMNFDTLQIARRPNFTIYLTETDEEVSRIADPDYEQFLADVWVGIVLTLMVLSCVCCMCSCLLYHKFQQWKMNVEARRRANNNTTTHQNTDSESLPSYTIVSGLPSYDEALEQLRKIRETNTHITTDIKVDLSSSNEQWVPQTPPTPVASLSVLELFQLYKTNTNTPNVPLSSVDTKT